MAISICFVHSPLGPCVHHGARQQGRPAETPPAAWRSKSPPALKSLNLQAGDLVEVRSPSEIAFTLDEKGLNRGLSFDREMLPYCGRTLRVSDRVHRLIDDKTGRMLNVGKDCLILEGAVCSGQRSAGRWFCPREIYPYWREAWLRRVEKSDARDVG